MNSEKVNTEYGARRLLDPVQRYYTDKLLRHGPTALGVDWNSEQSQELRFAQLCGVIDRQGACSLNDLGCGYGSLFSFLEARGIRADYLGIDLSPAMLDAALRRVGPYSRARYLLGEVPDRVADYSVASGIFNVKLGASDADWSKHVLATLEIMNAHSARGFAFNCLTSYSDAGRMRPDLYYADPLVLFDHCKRRFAHDIALLHDYGLYEFTIIVRKNRTVP